MIPCPRCGSVLPASSMCALYRWRARRWWEAWRDPLIAEKAGALVACQALGCGHEYGVHPKGAFEFNDTAFPIARMPREPEPRSAEGETDEQKQQRKARPRPPAWKPPPPV